MATVYGVNLTLVNTGGISQVLGGLIDGRVKCMLDTYALTTGNTAGEIIKLGSPLPGGANVIVIGLMASAAQSSLTYKLGDQASSDRYAATGRTGLQTAASLVLHGGLNKVVTAGTDDQIQLTTEAATATAGTLYFFVLYSTD